MKVSIITRQATGIMSALLNMGIVDLQAVVWLRSPVRINGVWRADVQHGVDRA